MNHQGVYLVKLAAGLAVLLVAAGGGQAAVRSTPAQAKPVLLQYELAGLATNQAGLVREFRLWRREAAWCILVRDSGERGRVRFSETGTLNGREIYYTIQHPPRDAEAEAYAKGQLALIKTTNQWRMPENQGIATITSNTAPTDIPDGLTPHLWLMFVAGQWLAHQQTNWIVPVYDMQASLNLTPEYRQEAYWQLHGEPPGLPEWVVYRNDGWLKKPEGRKLVRTYRRYPPYDVGYTNAIFAAAGFAKVGGLMLPEGFVYARYEPSQAMSRDPVLLVRERVTVVVTQALAVCGRATLLPEMQKVMHVMDHRLRDAPQKGTNVIYPAQGGVWPGVERARQVVRDRQWKETKKRHGPLGLVVLVVLLAGPLIVMQILRVWNKRKASTN